MSDIRTVRDKIRTACTTTDISPVYTFAEGIVSDVNEFKSLKFPLAFFQIPRTEQPEYTQGYANSEIELFLLHQHPQSEQKETSTKQDWFSAKYKEIEDRWAAIANDLVEDDDYLIEGAVRTERVRDYLGNKVIAVIITFTLNHPWYCDEDY